MSAQTALATIAFKDLPNVGDELAGGTFVGIYTQPDGSHFAIALQPAQAEDLTWQDAMDWAAEQGGQLPTRPIAAMLFANVKAKLQSDDWHWTSETNADYPSSAWGCGFRYGSQISSLKSCEGCAVAVRSIPLSA